MKQWHLSNVKAFLAHVVVVVVGFVEDQWCYYGSVYKKKAEGISVFAPPEQMKDFFPGSSCVLLFLFLSPPR